MGRGHGGDLMAEWLSQTEYAVIGALLLDQGNIGEVV